MHMHVCDCMYLCVCVRRLSGASGRGLMKRGKRGEQPLGSLSKSLVTGAQTRPQLAPPPTILAFLPLSGTQRVNSNSLLMNWLLKVVRQADPAHLLNTHTHWQQNTQTQTQRRKYVALKYISLLSRLTVQLDLNTCGGSLNSAPPEQRP